MTDGAAAGSSHEESACRLKLYVLIRINMMRTHTRKYVCVLSYSAKTAIFNIWDRGG